MALDYTTYKLQLQTLVVSQDPDPAFDNILPACIDYAEQRIYRELNLISTVQVSAISTLVLGDRNTSIDTTFVVVNNVNILTPAGSDQSSGTRVPLVPVTRDVLDMLWPGNSVTGQPQMFSMVDQWTMIIGPSPDDNYALEVTGTYRPDPLSEANPNTFLTDRLPDLFMAASMVYMSGYMRNFGAQASDPQMGMSWEQQYDLLKGSANSEELRKHFYGDSWTSLTPPAGGNSRG